MSEQQKQHPHTALVESLRAKNGFVIEGDDWKCFSCRTSVSRSGLTKIGMVKNGVPVIALHDGDCPVRLALEHVEPPTPKLTRLPIYFDRSIAAMEQLDSAWLCKNRKAIESIIAQQEQPMHSPGNTTAAPTNADIERLGKRIAALEVAMLDAGESRPFVAALESRQNAETPTTGAAKPKCERCGDVATENVSEVADEYNWRCDRCKPRDVRPKLRR